MKTDEVNTVLGYPWLNKSKDGLPGIQAAPCLNVFKTHHILLPWNYILVGKTPLVFM